MRNERALENAAMAWLVALIVVSALTVAFLEVKIPFEGMERTTPVQAILDYRLAHAQLLVLLVAVAIAVTLRVRNAAASLRPLLLIGLCALATITIGLML